MNPETIKIMKGIIYQITSARWLLTLCVGAVYAYLACKEIIDPKDSLSVIMIVFALYFNRSDRVNNDKPETPQEPEIKK